MATNVLLLLLVLLALSIPVAATMGFLAVFVADVYSPLPVIRAIGEKFWQHGRDFILIAIPMFILLGEILLRSGIAQRMYDALAKWLSWLPGGLMHSNIGACTMFSATSGSSVATAATVSTVALPEVDKRGYNERLFLGTLAAGGTLGILIPPSINLIVYGLLTDTSVPDLYLAGFLPGFLLAALFMVTVIIACMFYPSWGGERILASWGERFACLIDLLPPLLLFIVVVGSIYAGWATPTEAAAVGVVFALVLAAFYRRLTLRMVLQAIEGAMTTTAMVMLIILAAIFLNFILGIAGVIQAMTEGITSLGLEPFELLMVIIIFLVVLGCFMETYSMLILTAPLLVPIIAPLDFGIHDAKGAIDMDANKVWFGIIMIILLEAALITPPVGVNLYVVQGVRGRGTITDTIVGSVPFVITMFMMIALIILYPPLTLNIFQETVVPAVSWFFVDFLGSLF
jgi:tripartite ATP-independent transporter DctM subunit